jgi:ribosomal protein S18 acetylase RimI-like enzyme
VIAPSPAGAALAWRAPTRADLPAWLELVRAQQLADGEPELMGAEELAAGFDDAMWAPQHDARLVEAPSGALAADGVVGTLGAGREFVRVFCWGGVHPEWRGRGLGRELFGWQVDRGHERYAELDTDLPGVLETGCPVDHPAGRLYARFGFSPTRYWSHMAHDLAVLPAGAAGTADGLRTCRYREELSERVRRAHNEAFADHWGSAERDKSSWLDHVVGHPRFRPELSFVVLDGVPRDPAVAAYLVSYESEPAPGEPSAGYIGFVGTRRSWRGRGLASALVAHALAAMKDAGYARALLTVDTENPTGAHRLYERLGFATERRYVTYQRPITP